MDEILINMLNSMYQQKQFGMKHRKDSIAQQAYESAADDMIRIVRAVLSQQDKSLNLDLVSIANRMEDDGK